MKLSKIKSAKISRPFVDTKDLIIFVKNCRNKITEFDVIYKEKNKIFKVLDFNIMGAWKEMENWLNKQK